jgi:hypothetical protein
MNQSLLLPILGVVGISSLLLGLSSSSDDHVKEDYMTNVAVQSIRQPYVVSKNNLHAFQSGQTNNLQMSAVPMADYPLLQGKLGAAPVTRQPFVSMPNYQQSIPQPKPSLQVGADIRYKPPTYDQMGVSDRYQCNETYKTYLKEGYTGQEMQNDPSNPNPKTGCNAFAAGNYNDLVEQNAEPLSDTLYVGDQEMLNESGVPENYMVFDRFMTVTNKQTSDRVNRVAGTRDFIRGDIPVAVDNSHKGWFSPSAGPAGLTTGAVYALFGETQSGNDMLNFMQSYGYSSQTAGGGPVSDFNKEIPSSKQYMARNTQNQLQGINGNTVNTIVNTPVLAFA